MRVSINSDKIILTDNKEKIGNELFAFPETLEGLSCNFIEGEFNVEITIKNEKILIRKKKIDSKNNFIGIEEAIYVYNQRKGKRQSEFLTVNFVSNIINDELKKDSRLSKEDILFYFFNYEKDFFINNVFTGMNFFNHCIERSKIKATEIEDAQKDIQYIINLALCNKKEIVLSGAQIYKANLLGIMSSLNFSEDFKSLMLTITPSENVFTDNSLYKNIRKIVLMPFKENCFHVEDMQLKEKNGTTTTYESIRLSNEYLNTITPFDYIVTNNHFEKKILSPMDYSLRVIPFENTYPYKIKKVQLPIVVECFGFPTYLSIEKGKIKESFREYPFNLKKEFRPVFKRVKKDLSKDYRSCFYFLCLGKNRKYTQPIMKFFTESNDFSLDEVTSETIALFFINGNKSQEIYEFYRKVKSFYVSVKRIMGNHKDNLESLDFRRDIKNLVNNYNWELN